ncbi:hypothetical protein V22_07020 [Calycomorphotria hydatis]|uniref:Uncharacterized protein n=1 Tax=Calycomorphotria hydatis TaxID=2528027 RepID=A0A517T536_9PLAN|nr:hypothetical protein V22_07020 [Calycomorphotria hydatis]
MEIYSYPEEVSRNLVLSGQISDCEQLADSDFASYLKLQRIYSEDQGTAENLHLQFIIDAEIKISVDGPIKTQHIPIDTHSYDDNNILTDQKIYFPRT